MNERDMMHGREWRGQRIVGFLASEKLNGCRAYWDGYEMWSRGGQTIHLPHHVRAGLPTGIPLDGEIFAGRQADGFHLACEAVNHDRWDARCTFQVFDAPAVVGGWEARMQAACAAVGLQAYVECVSFIRIQTAAQAIRWMDEIRRMGGEGIMLRAPHASYKTGRHQTVLKMKQVPDYLRPRSLKIRPAASAHALAA